MAATADSLPQAVYLTTVKHTALVGIEPTIFRSWVQRATSCATETYCVHVGLDRDYWQINWHLWKRGWRWSIVIDPLSRSIVAEILSLILMGSLSWLFGAMWRHRSRDYWTHNISFPRWSIVSCNQLPSISHSVSQIRRVTGRKTFLRSHVVYLSVCPSVCNVVDCDHIGWNSSKLISPFVSLECSLFATPTWRVCSKGNTPKFGHKVTHPLLIWASETFDRKLRPNGYR